MLVMQGSSIAVLAASGNGHCGPISPFLKWRWSCSWESVAAQGTLLFCDSGKVCIHPGQHIIDHAFPPVTSRHSHVALLCRCVMQRPGTEGEHRGPVPQVQQQCYGDSNSATCALMLGVPPLSISLAAAISAAAQHQLTSYEPDALSQACASS